MGENGFPGGRDKLKEKGKTGNKEIKDIKEADEENLMWTPVKVEHIVRDQWIDFRRVDYRYPDGREYGPFYEYSRRSYCVIVPVDEEGRFICVRQFRYGIKEVTNEFPAGGIETGGGAEYENAENTERPLECARRELMEETGYASDRWSHLLTIPSNATIADNYAYIFLAEGCRKVSGLHLDETEDLEPVLLTGKEIEKLIAGGKFQQMCHVLAFLLARERL